MKYLPFALAACLAASPAAIADEVSDIILKRLDQPGFEFFDAAAAYQAVISQWPEELDHDASKVGPIEKALTIATQAIGSTRTRTSLSFGQIRYDGGAGRHPVSLIIVRHYNLGPQIHAQTLAAYGEDSTAPVEDFGTGDHMEWRFLTVTTDDDAGFILEAVSRVIPPEEALASDCNGRLCLDPDAGIETLANWRAFEATLPGWTSLYPPLDEETALPAQAAAELATLGGWASAGSGGYQWTGGEHPEAARDIGAFRFIAIDRNLGQEAVIDAVWHETLLNDHELAELSFRRLDIAGDVSFMRFTVMR